jgi:hypothetical protein
LLVLLISMPLGACGGKVLLLLLLLLLLLVILLLTATPLPAWRCAGAGAAEGRGACDVAVGAGRAMRCRHPRQGSSRAARIPQSGDGARGGGGG